MTILSWRCPVHGATADPLLLGGHIYCPDENCTREVLRDRAAEARTISVVTLRPRTKPGSVRMRVAALLRVSVTGMTARELADEIERQTGRRPNRDAVGHGLTHLRKNGSATTDTRGRHGDPQYRGLWRWIGEV